MKTVSKSLCEVLGNRKVMSNIVFAGLVRIADGKANLERRELAEPAN